MVASIFPEIVLRGSFPFWLAVVLMVGIAGLAGGFYFTESMRLGTGRRLVLAGLRALARPRHRLPAVQAGRGPGREDGEEPAGRRARR